MENKMQWEINLNINAPVEVVWEYGDDISLIPKYHPRVKKVELVSGQAKRAQGVSYKCHFKERGKMNWCTEHITEYVPPKKMTITVPEDSMGLGKIFSNFKSELLFSQNTDNTTTLKLRNFYNPLGLKGKVINILFKSRMRKKALDTFMGLKALIEKETGRK